MTVKSDSERAGLATGPAGTFAVVLGIGGSAYRVDFTPRHQGREPWAGRLLVGLDLFGHRVGHSANVVIFAPSGAGKTLFASVLARRYRAITRHSRCSEKADYRTLLRRPAQQTAIAC